MEALPKICRLCKDPKTEGKLEPLGICPDCAQVLQRQQPTENSELRAR